MGAVVQRINYMQQENSDLKKESSTQDRQLSDYYLLVNQLLRNTRNAEDRKRLAKIFVQHADQKDRKYDKGELLKIITCISFPDNRMPKPDIFHFLQIIVQVHR